LPADESPASGLRVVEADLSLTEDQRVVLELINAYACDEFGSGQPLSPEVRERLIPGLRAHPTTLIFVAYLEREPVGIAVCFFGFSTFMARPLINIHDLAVLPGHRGAGIGQALLAAVEEKGRALGCCKLTLEVQEHNHRARQAYTRAGFTQSLADTEAGGSLFMSKTVGAVIIADDSDTHGR
jgi:GNAT superfamily N-acetyltransferase